MVGEAVLSCFELGDLLAAGAPTDDEDAATSILLLGLAIAELFG